ncbi:MAG: hypothetical protein LBJ72_11310 [Dysgonamonadaceae bacterium]|jgi:hypothetical protein|nr:hypothetical protein [Dysgonamonadaceae bacterium]
MKKVILSLFVMGAVCISSTAIAQDAKKDAKAKTETTSAAKDSKSCCSEKKAADTKTCCSEKKTADTKSCCSEKKTADTKSCCSAKKTTADNKSAGKK